MSCPQKFKSIVDICNICSFCLSGKQDIFLFVCSIEDMAILANLILLNIQFKSCQKARKLFPVHAFDLFTPFGNDFVTENSKDKKFMHVTSLMTSQIPSLSNSRITWQSCDLEKEPWCYCATVVE